MRRGGCGGGCAPCAQNCPPTSCPPLSGTVLGSAFAATPQDGTSILPGGQAAFTQVPGVAVVPFVSGAAEALLIDASASVLFAGALPNVALFRVNVDGVPAPFSQFGEAETAGAGGRVSGAVTLRVPVAGGVPHIVSLEWSSPGGAGSATVDVNGHANIRVIRVVQ